MVDGKTSSGVLGDGGRLISGFELKLGGVFRLTGLTDVSGQVADIIPRGGIDLYMRRHTLESELSTSLDSGIRLSNTNIFNLIPLEDNYIMVGSTNLTVGNNNGTRQISIGVLYPISEIVPAYISGSRLTIEAALRASFANGMLGVSISAYLVPGLTFKTASKQELEETQMRKRDFTVQDELQTPSDIRETNIEYGIGLTGELRF